MIANPRILAFYLPQYYPIPENDEWWGKGFTDWINVAKSRPRFRGHYQPHLPADLGFYDLRNEETRIAQAELASSYGIYGFCYHHYWFNGKMLLDRPFSEVLGSKKPDFPFCLCWANENWTRRWDGKEHEILIEQNYKEYDPIIHLNWLNNAFSDHRYVKIDNKPLLLIYDAVSIPDISENISIWRRRAEELGHEGLYICPVKSVHNNVNDEELIEFGFDAIVDFVPNMETLKYRSIRGLPKYYLYSLFNSLISLLKLDDKFEKFPLTSIYKYGKMVNEIMKKPIEEYRLFPCLIPSWDNSARKKSANVIQNNDFGLFEKWLKNSIQRILHYRPDEQIIFINAWNEWAEGCHLEPDLRNKRNFLEAILKVMNEYQNS